MHYDFFSTALGELLLAADDEAIRLLDYQQGSHARRVAEGWKRMPSRFAQVREEVTAYLHGELQVFTVNVAPQGTAFQCQVWQALRQIPYGQTRSYADIACAIGRPKAVRAVGAANGANPISLIIPCHRVIGRNGALTGYAGGMDNKAKLLELEARVVAEVR